MGARTGETAADIAWSWATVPTIPGVSLCFVYSGSARPSAEWIAGVGVPVLVGFESSTTRAYAGSPYGREDAVWHRQRAREIGYPDDAGVWVCAADSPSTPPALLPQITAYFADWRAEYPTNVIVAYGNRAAVDAARAGAGEPFVGWGVGTWGYGECGAPDCAPAESDAGAVQSGNTPGPVPGATDLNWLYTPVSSFDAPGARRGGDSASIPRRGKRMELVVGPAFGGGRLAVLLDTAGDEVGRWTSTGQEGVDTFLGTPTASVVPFGTQIVSFKDGDEAHLKAWIAVVDAIERRKKVAPAGGGNEIDVKALAAALAPELKLEVNAHAVVSPK